MIYTLELIIIIMATINFVLASLVYTLGLLQAATQAHVIMHFNM